ncbi:vascular cell adhesion protein 1-like [Engraulis encrasicolus]|uniref:vascular cell adhesion protein 1-like n=1 Tax=Engraulis encrasicolus TaxID=184585 RepID=UPI002FD79528
MSMAKGTAVLRTALFCILSGFLAELTAISDNCQALLMVKPTPSINPATVNKGDTVTLTCSTTCKLGTNPLYIWYHNTQPVTNKHTVNGNTLTINSINNGYAGRYSCAVRGQEDRPSRAVCIFRCFGVAYNPESVCALEGSSVELHSYYSYPDGLTVTETFWFQHSPTPTDLSTTEHYKNRVTYSSSSSNHTLRITKLKSDDMTDYGFRIITKTKGGWSGSYVRLNVTGLQVQINPASVNEGSRVTLTCSTTCSLSSNPTYIWYKNTQPVTNKYTATGNTLTINSIQNEDAGRYSCAVRGHEDHPSPAVCVFKCYGVAYNPESVCALEGSSVELHSYYSYPDRYTITSTYWFIDGKMEYNLSTNGRVTYTGNSSSHTLSIRNLTSDDTRNYRFRFTTKEEGGWSGVNVAVSVTGLQVQINPALVNEGSRVTLTCITTCSLSTNPTFIWYKNSQPIRKEYTATGNTLTIDSATPGDKGNYSCAVEGHESLQSTVKVRYGPRKTVVSVDPSGDPKEGDSVNLTCSSDAFPPPRFTWHYTSLGRFSNVLSSKIYRFKNIRPEQSGQYYCEAHNVMGQNTSAKVQINVQYAPKNTSVSVGPAGDIREGNSVTLTCSSDANPPVVNYTLKTLESTPSSSRLQGGRSYNITNITAEDSGHYYCTAENKYGAQNSSTTHLDVLYSPRKTALSVSPPGDIREGDSVTLTCSSDANPPVDNYTWYRSAGDDTVVLGTRRVSNFTVILVSGLEGHYHCEAGNRLGKDNSTRVKVILQDSGFYKILFPVVGVISAVGLLLLCTIFWRRQKSNAPTTPQSTGSRQQSGPTHCDNDNDKGDDDDTDEVQYATVHFKKRTDSKQS